jgi:hypothetical protein
MERTIQDEKVWLPEYDGSSVVNVPASLLKFFGIEPPTPPLHRTVLPLEQYRGLPKALLLIFDSLGYHRLVSTGALEEWKSIPITSVCPSTTVAALTSLYTAETPIAHGMVGFRLFLKELGCIVNMIKLSPAGYHDRDKLLETGFDPKRFLPVKTIFQRLKKEEILSYAFTKMHYYRSGLSSLMHKGAEIVPYINPVDLFIQVKKVLRESRKRVFVTAYIDDFDIIAHYYGTGTREEEMTIHTFFRIMKENLMDEPMDDTLMLLTSDHGQMPSPPEAKIDILRYPALTKNCIMPPTGEFRTSYLHLKQGCKERCLRTLKTKLAQSFIVLTRDEAIEMKLFGDTKTKSTHAERLGDIVLISKGETYLHYPYGDFELKARHGGLHRNEMLVPFVNLSDHSC